MPRYFREKISTEELDKKILEALKKHPDFIHDWKFHSHSKGKSMNIITSITDHTTFMVGSTFYRRITPQIEKDFSKVAVDMENVNCDGWENTGLQTLDNGLTFFGMRIGGDWEEPVYHIIYWDGKKLRGYIPTKGNLWNTDLKEAYGNNEPGDVLNAFKRGLIELTEEEVESLDENSYIEEYIWIDFNLIKQDIKERILYKE